MAVNRTNRVSGYGVGDGLIRLAPPPIVAKRSPSSRDVAELGTLWINTVDSTAYCLVSVSANVSNWVTSPVGGATILSSLEVTPGNVSIPLGDLSVGGNSTFSGNLVVNGLTTIDDALIGIATIESNLELPATSNDGSQGVIKFNNQRFISNTGTSNTFLGVNSGNFTTISAGNTGIGYDALKQVTSGVNNVTVGAVSLSKLTGGSSNVAVGLLSLNNLTSGSSNIAIGMSSGNSYTTENNNICIGNIGVSSDQGVIRIGQNGTHNSAYIAGINGVSVGDVATVLTCNGSNQIGSATLTAGDGISITPSAGVLTIDSTIPPTTFAEDSGTATANNTGTLNMVGSHGIKTAGDNDDTITIAIDNTLTLGDLTPISNADALTVSSGDISLLAGRINVDTKGVPLTLDNLPFMYGDPDTFNCSFGFSGDFSIASGNRNTSVGQDNFLAITTGSDNSAFGYSALKEVTTGNNNTAIGTVALSNLIDGWYNIAIGYQSGSSYTGSESGNILIGNIGILGDSQTIRIGSSGTHTATYIAGINGVNVGSVATVVTSDSDHQLGTAVITAGTGLSVTPGANTITLATNGISVLNYTAVSSPTPYEVLSTDSIIGADSSSNVVVIQLPNTTTTGRCFTVKDAVGSANANSIVVTTVGGVVNIDGSTSVTLNTDWDSVQVMFNGSQYLVI
jgi:hypothetical protein